MTSKREIAAYRKRREAELLRWLPDDALDRIIASVGERYIPTMIDRFALRRDLRVCRAFYRRFSDVHSKTATQTRHEQLTAIERHAEALLDLIAEPRTPWDWELWFSITGEPRPDPEDLRAGLRWLRLAAANARDDSFLAQTARPRFRGETPAERLVIGLGIVYARHFGIAPARSRPQDGHKPGGPFVRFALAFAETASISLSAHTIAAAFKGHAGEFIKRYAPLWV